MRIVGLDLSWSETGIAAFQDGEFVGASAVPTKATWADLTRVEVILQAIRDVLGGHRSGSPLHPLVAIEGYSFGAKAGREKMGELGGIVKWELWQDGIEVVTYPVTTSGQGL